MKPDHHRPAAFHRRGPDIQVETVLAVAPRGESVGSLRALIAIERGIENRGPRRASLWWQEAVLSSRARRIGHALESQDTGAFNEPSYGSRSGPNDRSRKERRGQWPDAYSSETRNKPALRVGP